MERKWRGVSYVFLMFIVFTVVHLFRPDYRSGEILSSLLKILIPLFPTLASLIAVVFMEHFEPREKTESKEENTSERPELKDDFISLVGDFFYLTIINILVFLLIGGIKKLGWLASSFTTSLIVGLTILELERSYRYIKKAIKSKVKIRVERAIRRVR